MEVSYKNFDIAHIPDNEATYFGLLTSVIENVDKHCYFVITKNPDSYTFRISTSIKIVAPLISQINLLNSKNGIMVDFSKSIKNGNLFWRIPLN